MGLPQPGYEIRLLTHEGGGEVTQDATGELFIRGHRDRRRLSGALDAAGAILHEGWFRTGDLARVDSDGAIFLRGRSHSVINIGGMRCFPEEVEATLNTHPGVLESRVSPKDHGAPDHPRRGDRPARSCVASQDQRGTDSALPRPAFPVTRYRSRFVTVSSIPKTPSGKIQRTAPAK